MESAPEQTGVTSAAMADMDTEEGPLCEEPRGGSIEGYPTLSFGPGVNVHVQDGGGVGWADPLTRLP